MDQERIIVLQDEFKRELTTDILPFWLKHGWDTVNGGIHTALGKDGELLDSDKSVWFQGRAAWTYSTAYRVIGKDSQYLAMAKSCIDFTEGHCIDSDGRYFFRVTAEGKPVIKRIRYIFSEAFAVLGMAAYSRASGDLRYAQKAEVLFEQIQRTLQDPGALMPKFNPETRSSTGLAVPMILLVVAQELREALIQRTDHYNILIDRYIKTILTTFVDREHKAIVEQVGVDGSFQYDHLEGRLINPGHGIEAIWFILKEAKIRGDKALGKEALVLLDWMWEWGWDVEYGGIIYFRDVLGKPAFEYWHDMKFWWPQTEAILATLYAWQLSEDQKYRAMFEEVYTYTMNHFPDRKGREWYGYLHRDGRVSTPLKGTMYKGPFHTPRMFLEGYEMLQEN